MQMKCSSSTMALTTNVNHNNNNTNNNNDSDNHIITTTLHNSSTTIGSHDSNPNGDGSINSAQTSIRRQRRRRQRRLFIDALIVLLVTLPIVICEFLLTPFERGFFCNDESIRYPYRLETINTLELTLLFVFVPMAIMLIVEYLHQRHCAVWPWQITKCVQLWPVPRCIRECLRHYMYYLFGLLLTFDISEVAKYTIGRLRPHFYAVCQPRMLDGSSCADEHNQQRYIEQYYCTGVNDAGASFTPADLLQARLSFPSAHASLIWHSMIYMIIYLQYRLPNYQHAPHLCRAFVQFLCLCLAWFTALSRIMDYFHHWSDVLAGILLGLIGALVTAYFITKFYKTNLGKNLNHSRIVPAFTVGEVAVVATT